LFFELEGYRLPAVSLYRTTVLYSGLPLGTFLDGGHRNICELGTGANTVGNTGFAAGQCPYF
jgi:hypothetical protein